MIRKLVIILLTMMSIASGSLLAVGFVARYPETPGWESKRGWRKCWGDPTNRSWLTMEVTSAQLFVEHCRRVDPSHEVVDDTFGVFGFFVRRHTVLPSWTALVQRRQVLRYAVLIPLWAVFPSVSAYPTIALIRGPLRRRRRRLRGLCLSCGYDLTGNTTGVCSECAEPISTEKT